VTFKKGNKLGKGRGALNKIPAEAKDVLARAYTALGGFQGFVDWCKSSDERLDYFYTKMWIKLLPMNIHVESNKNVVYKSYHEVSIALADHGISLDSIEKLKQIEFKPPEREDEEVN
jgi:hypothetical protein